jgi:glycosidase
VIPSDVEADTYQLMLSNPENEFRIDFPVLDREKDNNVHQGFNSEDIIYLITPDRFVNGDPENDHIEDLRDKWDKQDKLGRKGGDIQGIIDKLEYITDLGVSAIWINPLIENDMDISYHGYGATDFYKIDPRFGTNELYKQLVESAHQLGLKVIMDHVTMLNDIYGDSLLKNNVRNGWFVDEMPDLNQKNPFLANYIIQNTLWWIEYAGLDGIREDTYPYADPQFLANWAEAILNEYPDFNIVGEVWIHDPVFLSTYQTGSYFPKKFDSHLPSVTDFGLFEAFGRVFNRDQSIEEIHRFLSQDFLYPDPNNLVTCLDNHDVMRAIDLVNGDIQRFKLALKILLTTRGIPQIYYGTEIGLKGGEDHGEIRRKFPGGFPGDTRNAFQPEGRTETENNIWHFLKNLIEIRKTHTALSRGQLTHYPVWDEYYMYFRSYEDEKIMIIVNNKLENRELELKRLAPLFSSDDVLINIKTGEEIRFSIDRNLMIPGYDAGIYKITNSKFQIPN